MSNFKEFAIAVNRNWVEMSKTELFRISDDHRELEAVYLASFPEGTNPLYLTNTEHDCTCCRQFIRNIGSLVAIKDGQRVSVWSELEPGSPYPYNVVSARMAEWVESRSITGVFRTRERQYGAEQTLQQLEDTVIKWNHFHGRISDRHFSVTPEAAAGEINQLAGVLRRGLEELKKSALDQIIDLVSNNQLYRGEEHLPVLRAFFEATRLYSVLSGAAKENFVWANASSYWARFRNTVIGTLAVDISNGVDIDTAVRSFESKVAPINYKRPTTVVSAEMIKGAMAKVDELGIRDGFTRRHAKLSDVSVNNVLWVNNSSAAKMRDSLESALLATVAAPSKIPQAMEISIADFIRDVAPSAKSMKCIVRSSLSSNFVSVTAPSFADSPGLFKWDNGLAWSYDGNITDSIKEKVKAAGGNTNAKLRFSLAWSNFDDLDIHVYTPLRQHIYFADKAGCLDVDMNAGHGRSRSPVENVSFDVVADGEYQIHIYQYNQRETTDFGFEIEIESAGKLYNLKHPAMLKQAVIAATVVVQGGVVTSVTPGKGLTLGASSINKWGVESEKWVDIQTIMYSPNHWDGQSIGNRH